MFMAYNRGSRKQIRGTPVLAAGGFPQAALFRDVTGAAWSCENSVFPAKVCNFPQ